MARVNIDKDAGYKVSTMPGFIPVLEEKINAARDIAKVIAPVESGAYKQSIETAVGYNDKAQVVEDCWPLTGRQDGLNSALCAPWLMPLCAGHWKLLD